MQGQISKKLKHLKGETNIDDKLYLNRWKPDHQSHLVIKDPTVCAEKCAGKDCTFFCPARVYEWRDDRISVGHEGCLECGACRIACPHGNIGWRYPRGGYGVQFRLA
ncbi:4Fe-4S ferredoxin, iron-sulfur binding domain protein [Desulforamulus reducens MI-1]|uniref:Ferredoxin-like protein n=1 Tax=Desulforamulus reducens (strain ATCC BAA-1160 / DSM 100696 / MI-1) TaxID=349161 RepID=A4J4R6_DESRM|nr:4Fe-4S dicluster domain-containing protein [Desulforamulus reducens]ABO50069.1 4Fe-4S ferredoxin, iron-sulfur binding domain protein [Desulforamulus reducens MI-1]